MKQLTREQAIALADSGAWADLAPNDRALFQLHQEKLCMPFGVFREAVQGLLGRPVFSHEFATPAALLAEASGGRSSPSLAEIMDMIPSGGRLES